MRFFELSVALKYLTPRWRQLSVSIISLISILVIALVVWLIVVFFSVTHGLEKNWIKKLIALTAPIRITPTEQYYDSYYYQIDGISADSDYSLKSITEKKLAVATDPYDPAVDEEIPRNWPAPKLDQENNLIDPVKSAFAIIETIPEVSAREYEMTFANLRLRLLRDMPKTYAQASRRDNAQNQSFITQSVYLGSFDPESSSIADALLPFTMRDVGNMLNTLTLRSDNSQQDNPDSIARLDGGKASDKFLQFFQGARIAKLQTPKHGWAIPREILPDGCSLEVCASVENGDPQALFIPKAREGLSNLKQELQTQGVAAIPGVLHMDGGTAMFLGESGEKPLSLKTPLILEGEVPLLATVVAETLSYVARDRDIDFVVRALFQGIEAVGVVPFSGLEIAEAELRREYELSDATPFQWLHTQIDAKGKSVQVLPSDPDLGDSILLPRGFRDAGVLVGDRGYLSYSSPTASSMQEQRIPIVVAGFYDPGIMPLGGKFVLANQEVTSLLRAMQNQNDTTLSNGINVRFSDLSKADGIKERLESAFEGAGIAEFWKIETYKEFEFTKDIIQQLHSEKNLFSLLAVVIIIVACSNIISMLIILVNDKKQEIGILRSMGASSWSIAMIFGACGVVMGLLGSAIGIVLAFLTLLNLQGLVGMLSSLQGHEMFKPAFYGERLPTDLSFEAIVFVIAMTAVISTLAGIVPAIKACLLRPSEILRDQ